MAIDPKKKAKPASAKSTESKTPRAKPAAKTTKAKTSDEKRKPAKPGKPSRVPRSLQADGDDEPKRRKKLNYAFNTDNEPDEKPKRKPAARKPTTRKPAAEKTTMRKPAVRKVAAGKTVVEKPATRKPTARKPAAKSTSIKEPSSRSSKPAAERDERSTRGVKPPSRKPANEEAYSKEPYKKEPYQKSGKPSAEREERSTRSAKPAGRKPSSDESYSREPYKKEPYQKSGKPTADREERSTRSAKPAGRKPASDESYSREPDKKDRYKKEPYQKSPRSSEERSERGERSGKSADGYSEKRFRKPDDKRDSKAASKSTTPILIDDKSGAPSNKKTHRKGSYDPKRKRSLGGKPSHFRPRSTAPAKKRPDTGEETIRLNRYLANAGIASRRESDELIKTGMVEVNGKTITEMGYQVKPGDVVRYAGDKLSLEKPIYVLLNKPKDYITSGTETASRRSVFQLLRGVGQQRMWPVGKLDRNTTGLLLFTNDDTMTKKLTLPRQGVKKVYHVFTDKNVKKEHLDAMKAGVETEEGWLKVSDAAFVSDAKDKKQVGLEIHGGRSRTARMMFEHFGYQVLKLDRVIYAGLSKKDLPRGRWRLLSQQEISMLKML